jgi:hypothetical protein
MYTFVYRQESLNGEFDVTARNQFDVAAKVKSLIVNEGMTTFYLNGVLVGFFDRTNESGKCVYVTDGTRINVENVKQAVFAMVTVALQFKQEFDENFVEVLLPR